MPATPEFRTWAKKLLFAKKRKAVEEMERTQPQDVVDAEWEKVWNTPKFRDGYKKFLAGEPAKVSIGDTEAASPGGGPAWEKGAKTADIINGGKDKPLFRAKVGAFGQVQAPAISNVVVEPVKVIKGGIKTVMDDPGGFVHDVAKHVPYVGAAVSEIGEEVARMTAPTRGSEKEKDVIESRAARKGGKAVAKVTSGLGYDTPDIYPDDPAHIADIRKKITAGTATAGDRKRLDEYEYKIMGNQAGGAALGTAAQFALPGSNWKALLRQSAFLTGYRRMASGPAKDSDEAAARDLQDALEFLAPQAFLLLGKGIKAGVKGGAQLVKAAKAIANNKKLTAAQKRGVLEGILEMARQEGGDVDALEKAFREGMSHGVEDAPVTPGVAKTGPVRIDDSNRGMREILGEGNTTTAMVKYQPPAEPGALAGEPRVYARMGGDAALDAAGQTPTPPEELATALRAGAQAPAPNPRLNDEGVRYRVKAGDIPKDVANDAPTLSPDELREAMDAPRWRAVARRQAPMMAAPAATEPTAEMLNAQADEAERRGDMAEAERLRAVAEALKWGGRLGATAALGSVLPGVAKEAKGPFVKFAEAGMEKARELVRPARPSAFPATMAQAGLDTVEAAPLPTVIREGVGGLLNRARKAAIVGLTDQHGMIADFEREVGKAAGVKAPGGGRAGRAYARLTPFKPTQSAAIKTELSKGMGRSAMEAIEGKGMTDLWTSKQVHGKSLKDIVAPVIDQYEDFKTYAIARRLASRGAQDDALADVLTEAAPELEAFRHVTPELAAHADGVVQAMRAESPELAQMFDDVLREYTEYNQKLLGIMGQGKRLSPEQVAQIAASDEVFVPIRRAQDGGFMGMGRDMMKTPRRAVKRWDSTMGEGADPAEFFRGLVRESADIVDETAADTARAYSVAARNDIQATLLDVNDMAPEGMKLFHPLEHVEGMAAFNDAATNGKGNIMRHFDNGVERYYEVSDPLMVASLKALNADQQGALTKGVRAVNGLFRKGVTGNPFFAAYNIIRDTWVATAASKGRFIPVWDNILGAIDVIRGADIVDEVGNAGGLFNSTLSGDLTLGQKIARGLTEDTSAPRIARQWQEEAGKTLWQRGKRLMKGGQRLWGAIGEVSEDATRVAVGKRAKEYAQKTLKFDDIRDIQMYMAREARNTTMDFAKGGTITKAINTYVPFFNASFQGTVRAAQNMTAAKFMAVAGAATVLDVALWQANQDDPAYQNMPKWRKDKLYNIPLWKVKEELGLEVSDEDRNTYITVPKGFEIGLAGSFIVRMLDEIKRDAPETAAEVAQAIVNNLDVFSNVVPNLGAPAGIHPLLENKANYSQFQEGPLESQWELEKDPSLRYRRGTPESIRAAAQYTGKIPGLGQLLDDPIKLENFIRGTLGTSGQFATNIADQAGMAAGVLSDERASLDPRTPAQGLPVLGPAVKQMSRRFFKERNLPYGEHIDRLYDLTDERKQINSLVKDARERGDEATAQAIESENAQALEMGRQADKTIREINDLKDEIRAIEDDRSIPWGEKEALRKPLIEEIYRLTEAALPGAVPVGAESSSSFGGNPFDGAEFGGNPFD